MTTHSSESLQKLLSTVRRLACAPEEPLSLPGLTGSPLAFVLAALHSQLRRPVLVVTPSSDDAEKLSEDLRFFLRQDSSAQSPMVLPYPAWDVQPYQGPSPHADVTLQRLVALHQLQNDPTLLAVAPAEALLKRVIPKDVLERYTLRITPGAELERRRFLRTLTEAGYLVAGQVEDPGFVTARGDIIDVFGPPETEPVRIELYGDEVESIRRFSLESQSSTGPLERLTLLPVREEILGETQVALASSRWKALSETLEGSTALRRQIVEDLSRGVYFAGIEYHLGLLYPSPPLLTDYLPRNALVVLVEPETIKKTLKNARERLEQHHAQVDPRARLVPPPETLFAEAGEVISGWMGLQQLWCGERLGIGEGSGERIPLRFEPTSGLRSLISGQLEAGGMLKPLVDRWKAWRAEEQRVVIACQSSLQHGRLADLLEPYGISLPKVPSNTTLNDFLNVPPYATSSLEVLSGALSTGFRFPEGRLVFLSDADIFGTRIRTVIPSTRKLRNVVSSFSQLNRGDPVVHAVHGVGLFRGMVRRALGGMDGDFLQIEYAGGDKLYLPAHRVNTLQKYVGQGGSPTLDKLGGVTFDRTRRKVKESLVKLAHQLLELYAARALVQGFPFQIDRRVLEEFESTFPYDETPDQLAAIEAVYQDMASPRPMDRLVCGDVGYGKTEVAIRAAFVAIHNDKQVAVLVPTTVLALQHYRSLVERFAGYPIHVEMLNRFRSAREQAAILERLKKGLVDIVVGTHRILSDDVSFKDLGLLVVDEEHRFGVKHKERIKGFRKHLDVLTMTATPIPRTLHMALTGMREFSLIATAPRDRLAIRTYELAFRPDALAEAIRFELRRGGQVYFIHNRVQSIHAMAKFLKKLVPEATVGVGHGQMDERSLEKVMVDFIERRFDIFCCTTIVESGLDIANANTMIINRADRMGLAQLYQLRGRVGRSSKRAYCYLLTPAGVVLPEIAQRRLNTLVNNTELGTGFKIASEDLEMRGAGDLLGSSQSGNINAVGFDMYCELLERSIHELRGEQILDEIEPDIDLKVPAYMPEEFIPDLHQRLSQYKVLADARDEETLAMRRDELVDRYGPLPPPLLALMELMQVRLLLRSVRARALVRQDDRLVLRLDDTSPIDRAKVVDQVTRNPKRFRLTQDQRWVIQLTPEEGSNIPRTVKKLLQTIR